ncbi:MAG TPA: protein phosphatase 2C domain-containing protein [Nocardioides sp.]|nr:protein phosphatase 2C domain-containing protein [Nocardioides sp.]
MTVGGWTTVSGTRIGSVHVRDGLPLQDAVLTWSDGAAAVVAVADGHGHRLHFRSDTGAALAAVSAVEELRRAVPLLTDAETAAEVATATAGRIVETWRAKVAHHREANPYSPAELAERGAADDPLRAYGTTLLAAAAAGDLMVFLQIGDGDSVAVDARGEASRPLPEDPDLDGLHTSSLVQPDPLASLRVAVVDARVEEVVLAFLCTDGFGGSRVDADGWWRQTGEQLVGFTRDHGVEWVREQLPDWLEEPAQIGGDDTTMAILVRADL